MGLFDSLVGERGVFKNEEVFDLEYVPKLLPYRENQVKEIANSIKPLFFDRRPTNLLIHGGVGIGKTACVKWVFKELEEYSHEVIPVYINVWNCPTTHAVLSEISAQLGIGFTKGKSSYKLMQSIARAISKRKGVAIALDEIDKAADYDFLYSLYTLGNACLLLIANAPHFLLELDPRIRSRLGLKELVFKPYKKEEVFGILKERAKEGFRPGVISTSLLKRIAELTYEKIDVRYGIRLLYELGKHVDEKGKKEIGEEDLGEVLERVEIRLEELKLSEEERKILEAIKMEEGKLSGEVFNCYLKGGGKLSYSSFWRYLNQLERKGFIRIEATGVGFRGKSSRLFLR